MSDFCAARRKMWLIGVILLGAVTTNVRGDSQDNETKLVVVVVVDQLRADYITHFQKYFGQGGFCRLMREGAHFTNAYFSYGSSATGPGHATISTGRLPRWHGVVSNRCAIDDSPKGIRAVVWDSAAPLVGVEKSGEDDGRSPHLLLGPTLGDQLKVADSRSRVFSVALKDRAAILLGGHHPNGVYWLHDDVGDFVSSTYYCKELPKYVAAFNHEDHSETYAGKQWTRLAAEAAYAGCYANEPLHSSTRQPALGLAFPHALPILAGAPSSELFDAIWTSPYGNEVVLEFVQRLVAEEKLGGGLAVDMLCVGFSSNDLCGHVYGAESAEVMDFTLWTDRQIEKLLTLLDDTVGKGKYLIALTADHGVTTAVPLAKSLQLGGGFVDVRDIAQKLNQQLQKHFSTTEDAKPPMIVRSIELPWIFLDGPLLATLSSEDQARLLDDGAAFLKTIDGIENAFTATELSGPPPLPTDVQRSLAWRCYHPQRSGQLYMQLKDYWFKSPDNFAGHTCGTTHDRHVPILMMGPRVKPGRYFSPADPTDIVVTLATLLGVEPPLNASGTVLHAALDSSPPHE